MTDDPNKPAGLTSRESASWVAPLPDDKKPVAKDTPLCAACGHYHGSVMKWINCLSAEVRRLKNTA